MILDIEVYKNYTLFAFRSDKGKLKTFESFDKFSKKDIKKITKILLNNTIITFNGNGYDIPLVNYALLKNASTYQMYLASKAIIIDKINKFALFKKMGIAYNEQLEIDHIDIMNVAKGQAPLKLYGTRMHSNKLWELPYDPNKELTKKECKNLKSYCENDLLVTEDLYKILHNDLELREKMSKQYGLDLRSLNGANIAQNVILKEIGYDGPRPDAPSHIWYKAPKYIKFKTKEFKELYKYLHEHKFLLSDAKKVELPAKLKCWEFSHKYHIQLGIGGLHLSPKSTSFYSDEKNVLLDIDVTSFYPTMIIENKFLIKHLGDEFLKVYKGFYDTRTKDLKPKLKTLEKGSTEYNDALSMSNGYKLILNSFFGKTSERYSKLYDPSVMLHTTLTGQLILLMYIETLELAGYEVIYGNTDGITIKVPRKKVEKVEKIIAKLDKTCKVTMEFETFKSMHLRDVNSFVNITESGYVKSKGAYAKPLIGFDGVIDTNALDKNIDAPIVYEAVRNYLHTGANIEKTIKECEDVRQFLVGRTVRGGAMYGGSDKFCPLTCEDCDYNNEITREYQFEMLKKYPEQFPPDWKDKLNSKRGLTKKIIKEREQLEAQYVKDKGTYLGKVVRYYYSINGSSIHYKSNGNKVPKSDGAKPMLDLTETIPDDIDYVKYIKLAYTALEDLGV